MFQLRVWSDGTLSSSSRSDPSNAGLGRGLRMHAAWLSAAVLGLILSLGATLGVWQWEDRNADARFTAAAQGHIAALQHGIGGYLNKLDALRALFNSDMAVSRSDFERFARTLLKSGHAIQTLSWIPRVMGNGRAAFEQAAADDGVPDYQIKSLDLEGNLHAAPPRDEYYPVLYSTAPRSNAIYGLDLRSQLPTKMELERARDGDRLGFSPIQALVTADGNQQGFIFSLPIYRRGLPHESVDERRENLVGFVHGSVITGQLIESLLSSMTIPSGLDLRFYNPDEAAEGSLIYTHWSRLRADSDKPALTSFDRSLMQNLTAWGTPIMTAVATPLPNGPLSPRHDRALLVLIAGLTVTAAITASLHSRRRRASL
jgi:diguanylate cyclase